MSAKEYGVHVLKAAGGIALGIPIAFGLFWVLDMNIDLLQIVTVAVTILILSMIFIPIVPPRTKKRAMTTKQSAIRYVLFFAIVVGMVIGISFMI
ncbi:hypothetical protein JCM19037_2995 [Geomicrobium sp. JCM 19037]|uniref:hypothetical protein n=1 Tax=Geomicrobium sp. JCM 19037 TaxID=1460634 RepID=UPI00045F209B|nr:hypothetical protein [Geomicrobium sp. JCM 19037]GAK04565.1 hypothetical protein JCM19037_2995 [Geomicrobium sp. JCM 19037]